MSPFYLQPYRVALGLEESRAKTPVSEDAVISDVPFCFSFCFFSGYTGRMNPASSFLSLLWLAGSYAVHEWHSVEYRQELVSQVAQAAPAISRGGAKGVSMSVDAHQGRIPWLRRAMGDEAFQTIYLDYRIPEESVAKIKAAYPEAEIKRWIPGLD
jgi:hypothetical protein